MASKSPLVLDVEETISSTSTKKASPSQKQQKEVSVETIEKKIKEKIPNDYIPIKLPTNGRLDAPKILHFRDFTMDDALELNVLDEDDKLKAIISVLNNMVFEDFDCSNLHIKELIFILLSIHGTFISNKIEKSYYIDDTLDEGTKEGELNHSSNIGRIEIPISKLQIQNIDETYEGKNRETKFKEPFTIIDPVKKTKMKFRLSRIGDLLFAQEYCNDLFEEELIEFKPLKKALVSVAEIENIEDRNNKLEELIDNDEDNYEKYKKFLHKKDLAYIKIIQALQIVEINGEVLDTIEQKLKAYRENVSETVWPFYNSIIEEYNFGIIENYSFFCDELQKTITRRVSFQYLDFLPDIEQDYSKRYSVSFD